MSLLEAEGAVRQLQRWVGRLKDNDDYRRFDAKREIYRASYHLHQVARALRMVDLQLQLTVDMRWTTAGRHARKRRRGKPARRPGDLK